MKKILFTVIIILTALFTSGCAMILQGQQHDYEEQYNEDYAYLDDYAQVNWNEAQYDMQYTYYDTDRIFLVVYGNRIYVIPYNYFYHYIYPRFRMRIIWRSYDWFCNYWGYGYYNSLWSHWNYLHHRMYWQKHRNYYDNHKRNNSNRPFVIRKNEMQQSEPRYRYQIKPQPRIDGTRARIYIPRNNRVTGTTNYNYLPRNQRNYNYNTLPRNNRATSSGNFNNNMAHGSPPVRHTPPPPIKHENNAATGEKK